MECSLPKPLSERPPAGDELPNKRGGLASMLLVFCCFVVCLCFFGALGFVVFSRGTRVEVRFLKERLRYCYFWFLSGYFCFCCYFGFLNVIQPSGVVYWYVKSSSVRSAARFLSCVCSTIHSPDW